MLNDLIISTSLLSFGMYSPRFPALVGRGAAEHGDLYAPRLRKSDRSVACSAPSRSFALSENNLRILVVLSPKQSRNSFPVTLLLSAMHCYSFSLFITLKCVSPAFATLTRNTRGMPSHFLKNETRSYGSSLDPIHTKIESSKSFASNTYKKRVGVAPCVHPICLAYFHPCHAQAIMFCFALHTRG
jgi:hypothetical protein